MESSKAAFLQRKRVKKIINLTRLSYVHFFVPFLYLGVFPLMTMESRQTNGSKDNMD